MITFWQPNKYNKYLKQASEQNHWPFIGHLDIKSSHLNKSGIHLHKSGTLLMAGNFIKNMYNRNK